MQPNDAIKTVNQIFALRQFWCEQRTAIAISLCLMTGSIATCVYAQLSIPCIAFVASAVGISSYFTWYMTRLIYWRFGRGIKIGIAYDGFAVRLIEWIRLVDSFYELFEKNGITRRVALRRIDFKEVRDHENAKKFLEKWKFKCIVTCQHSEKKAAPQGDEWKFSTTLPMGSTFEEFLEVLARNMAGFTVPINPTDSTVDQLERHASNIFEYLLFLVGRLAYLRQDFETSDVLLETLDERFAGRGRKTNQPPRVDIRFWLACTQARDSFYYPSNPPRAEDLSRAIERCDVAIQKYGSEFALLVNAQARNLFYAFRLSEARDMTRALLRKREILPELPLHTALLNVAALSLLLEDFEQCVSDFREFQLSTNLHAFGIQLVDFADFARDYGYEAAVLMQVKYREGFGIAVDDELEAAFNAWCVEKNVPESLKTIQLR